jgi:DNA adenine methylase
VTPVALSRWQGSKRWLPAAYPHLLPLPRRGGRAFDCTAGSCVIPFWYLRQGYRVVIGDTNARLIGCLRNLQRRADDVIAVLTDIADVYRKAPDQREDFYARRECLNRLDPADVGASALFLFMLRACFNAVYRENPAGDCMPTWGDPPPSKDLIRADELRAIAALLTRADIRLGDFEATSADIRRGEAFFADAPYLGTFTGYSRNGWTTEDRKRLAAHLRVLDKRGVRWTATDSADHGALSDLGLWHVERVDVRRSGSCKAKGRGVAKEVCVMNWTPEKQEAA